MARAQPSIPPPLLHKRPQPPSILPSFRPIQNPKARFVSMAHHVGRRQAARLRPPVVLATPPPKLIPEAVHTSPYKEENPNHQSQQKLRDAPSWVPLKERQIYTLTSKYKSKNDVTNAANAKILSLINKSLDKRCASLTIQGKKQTRQARKSIVKLDKEAMDHAKDAQLKAAELLAIGETPVKIPSFLFTDAVLG